MIARRIGSTLCALLIAAGILFGAFLVGPALMGWERYVIVSGSMTGTYDRGSLVYDRVVPTADLKVGDVITYDPPAGAGPAGLVTHRIHAITRGPNGERLFRTKGDFNAAPDSWTFTLRRPTQARVAFHLPYVGFLLAALADRSIRMVIIGIPALLVALSVLAGLWREAGETAAAERRRA